MNSSTSSTNTYHLSINPINEFLYIVYQQLPYLNQPNQTVLPEPITLAKHGNLQTLKLKSTKRLQDTKKSNGIKSDGSSDILN